MSGGFSVKITLRKVSSIVAIIILGGILRFSQIQYFYFNFDQQVSAEAAFNFFDKGKLSLIGPELSFQGFFLGPIYDWTQFIPYGLCQLKPDCVPFFSTTISLIVVLLSYFLLKTIYGSKLAIIVVGIFVISSWQILFDLNPNSIFFILLSSVIVLYALMRYLSGNQKYLILGAFICGLAVVNFNPVFIFTTLAFFAASLIKFRQVRLPIFLLAIMVFFLNYAPILIFNFRHQNIIFENLVKFITQNASAGVSRNPITLIAKIIYPFYSNFLFLDINSIYGKLLGIFAVVLIIIGVYKLDLKSKLEHSFLVIWILVVTLGFLFYKGHIPDYYFFQALLPAVIIVAISLKIIFIYF